MSLSRRDFLTLGGLAAASALLAGCEGPSAARARLAGRPAISAWSAPTDRIWRALSRLTFGPRPDETAYAARIGLDAWLEEQLAPDTIDDKDALLRVRGLSTLTLDNSLIYSVRADNMTRELAQAALLRAIYSRRQLYETMVDFWSDHFSISTDKADCAWLKTIDDRAVIRPHALGSFGDLLWASMRSPAMLNYLDNQENHKRSPNENYARELLELHTLGVDAGYSQKDVQEVARCLTGWSVDAGWRRGQFSFEAGQHDDDAKTMLGALIAAGGGEDDGRRVYERVMTHPALPRFIASKLVRRFVADDPPPALISAGAETFRRTQGDIPSVLRVLIRSSEFRLAPPRYKRPLHYVAGALRQLNTDSDGGPALLEALARMGQPLFRWPTPDGFPDRTSAWNGGLLARWQFALALATDDIPGTRVDWTALMNASVSDGAPVSTGQRSVPADTTPAPASQAAASLSTLLLGAQLSESSGETLVRAFGSSLDTTDLRSLVAVLLAAPAYQWR